MSTEIASFVLELLSVLVPSIVLGNILSCIIVFIWDMPSSRKMMIEASFEGMRATPLFKY